MHFVTAPEPSTSDNLDRGKFRDHYTNEVSLYYLSIWAMQRFY